MLAANSNQIGNDSNNAIAQLAVLTAKAAFRMVLV
jgi:hypothetical protein